MLIDFGRQNGLCRAQSLRRTNDGDDCGEICKAEAGLGGQQPGIRLHGSAAVIGQGGNGGASIHDEGCKLVHRVRLI